MITWKKVNEKAQEQLIDLIQYLIGQGVFFDEYRFVGKEDGYIRIMTADSIEQYGDRFQVFEIWQKFDTDADTNEEYDTYIGVEDKDDE